MTVDEPKKIVAAVPDDGWNAWRRLCQYFNPSLASMEGRAWAELGMMAQNTAKSPDETKRMINELAVRIKQVEDISGEAVAATHAKSILLTFMDAVTRQHTAAFHGRQSDYTKLKQESLQFINNTVVGYPEAKPLGRVGGEEADWEEEERFNALGKGKGKTCYNCNGKCNFSRECPVKGKGKGGGKGGSKGMGKSNYEKGFGKGNFKGQSGDSKGKGKGPAKGCWTCGGSHYASQCTAGGLVAGTRVLGEWWPECSETETIKRLSALKTVHEAPTKISNSFQVLTEAEECHEVSEEFQEPVQSLNMLRRNRFCITKCKCCIATSSDSEDLIDHHRQVPKILERVQKDG